MTEELLDEIIAAFDRRYWQKKLTNLFLSILISVLGISSFAYGLRLESVPTIFRFMTVDGTLFITFCALLFIGLNLYEMKARTEMTWRFLYFVRLSAAVAEALIFIVVVTSQLPILPAHIPVTDRYDLLVMHLLLPFFGSISFLINDSPIGKLTVRECWNGTLFVTLYALILLCLITTKALPVSLIPYYFMDIWHTPWYVMAFAFFFIYGISYLMGRLLSEWNRKLSWLWFRNIVPAHAGRQ